MFGLFRPCFTFSASLVNKRNILTSGCVLALLGGLLCPFVGAQTAQFAGAQSTIPTSTLNYAYGVAVDGSGNVYVANSGFSRVLKETPSSGSYAESTIGSGLYFPASIAVDGSGNVYIADTDNNRALIETPSGARIYKTQLAADLVCPTESRWTEAGMSILPTPAMAGC
jgi:streptogramin lyase